MTHQFQLTIPLYPKAEHTEILMDGKPLHGITALCLKAGPDGFTNLVLEVQAPVACEFVGELFVALEMTPEVEDLFSDIFDSSLAKVGEPLEDSETKATFIRRVIEQCYAIRNPKCCSNGEHADGCDQSK